MATQTYRLVISYNSAGQFAQNVLHYSFDDSGYSTTVSAAQALIDAFNTHCVTLLENALSVHTQILSLKARRATGGGGFEAVKLGAVGDVGTRAGDLSASGLAPLVRFITVGSPPKSGRIFLPGISDSDCDESFVTPTYFTALQNAANALDDPLTLAGGTAPTATPCVLVRKPVPTPHTITLAVPVSWLGTQRRRQRPA